MLLTDVLFENFCRLFTVIEDNCLMMLHTATMQRDQVKLKAALLLPDILGFLGKAEEYVRADSFVLEEQRPCKHVLYRKRSVLKDPGTLLHVMSGCGTSI
jgi:hypothetical protein